MLGTGHLRLSNKCKIFHRKKVKLKPVNISVFFRNITSAEKWEVPVCKKSRATKKNLEESNALGSQ